MNQKKNKNEQDIEELMTEEQKKKLKKSIKKKMKKLDDLDGINEMIDE